MPTGSFDLSSCFFEKGEILGKGVLLQKGYDLSRIWRLDEVAI